MTPRQQQILTHIANAGPTTRRQLCQRFGIAGNTVGAHLHILAKRGLVCRKGWGDGTRSNGGRWEATAAAMSHIGIKQPPPISQCPSVWVYAARIAAANRGGRISP